MDSRCPRKLKSLPNEPCPEGRKAMDLARVGKVGGCPWFIADRESNYCVWKYLADNGLGTDPARVARMLYINDSEVKAVETKFRKIMKTEG